MSAPSDSPFRAGVTFSKHAVRRIEEMLIEPNRVRECLFRPDSIVKSRKYSGFNYRLGNVTLAVSFDTTPPTVVTALWSDEDSWQEDINKGGYEDREVRGERC